MNFPLEFEGRNYIPVESTYYDDGRALTRLYIAKDDPPVKEGGSYWKPLYLATWPEGAVPETSECISLEMDPVRKYNFSYHADFPVVKKTYEFDGKRWRLKEGWNYQYRKRQDNSYENEKRLFELNGYSPSVAEWTLQRKHREIMRSARKLVRKFRMDDPTVPSEVHNRVIHAAFTILRNGDSRKYRYYDDLADHFYRVEHFQEQYSFLAIIFFGDFEYCGNLRNLFEAFANEGVSRDELTAFWEIFGHDV